jgi:hypothetical protein
VTVLARLKRQHDWDVGHTWLGRSHMIGSVVCKESVASNCVLTCSLADCAEAGLAASSRAAHTHACLFRDA